MTDLDTGDVGARVAEAMARYLDDESYAAMFSPDGLARHVTWRCEDGYLVEYTTERIRASRGGVNDGKFAVALHRPTGKGARSGDPSSWKRVYFRTFAKRKTARARAEALYAKHSPRWAARNGVAEAA